MSRHAISSSRRRSAIVAPVQYPKNFEDNLIDSQGWGHQAIDVTPETTNASTNPVGNGIARGTLETVTVNPIKGTRSLHVIIPSRDPNIYRSTAAQLLHSRKPDMETDNWYSLAFRLHTGWFVGSDQPSALCTTNYIDPTGQWPAGVMSVPHSAGAANISIFSLLNGGDQDIVSGGQYYSGQPVGGGFGPRPAGMPGPLYLIKPGDFQYDVNYYVIWRCFYTTSLTGLMEGWIKKEGDPDFAQKFSIKGGQYSWFTKADGTVQELNPCIGFPTALWGNGWTTAALNANTPTTNDKFGNYVASALVQREAWFDCFGRCPSYDAALAQFN